ncbi:MAG: hypothetical protein Q8J97_00445 [Flavobacteriaceae bacterium]|nr:hypothetical protein [Flavobacteriaceae bacterium]
MKTLELIVAVIVISIFVGFIIWSCILVFRHEGPDESHSRTRYEQAKYINNKKLRA